MSGFQSMPLGLRKPDANTRELPGGLINLKDRSAILFLVEPVLTHIAVGPYRRVEPWEPSRLAMMFLVQWWFIRAGLTGRPPSHPGFEIWVGPFGIGKAQDRVGISDVKIVTHEHHAKRESSARSGTLLFSAPGPFEHPAARNRVMRLALGTPAPALFCTA